MFPINTWWSIYCNDAPTLGCQPPFINGADEDTLINNVDCAREGNIGTNWHKHLFLHAHIITHRWLKL